MKTFLIVLLFMSSVAEAKICNVISKVDGSKIGSYQGDACDVTKLGGPWGRSESVTHVEDTAAEAVQATAAASDKTALDQRAALLEQAKKLSTALQSSGDPKDKFLLYLLRKELNQ